MPAIGLITNSGWNIYNYRRPLLRAFKEKGWEVTIIAPIDEYIESIPQTEYDRYLPLRFLKPRQSSPLKELRVLIELSGHLRRESFDLIFTFTAKPNVYTPLLSKNVPILGTVTGLGSAFIQGGWTRFFLKRLYKFGYGRRYHLAFHNDADQRLFEQDHLISRGRTMLIPGSGIDTDAIQVKPDLESNRFVFLYAGRVMKEKGILEFLEAANQLVATDKKVSFVIAGLWEERGGIKKKIFKRLTRHPRINYLGHVEDMEGLWAMTDCLVLPSYREGMPRSVLEAMAHAKPIIVADTPGCRQTVEEGKNGWLVKPQSSEALQFVMSRMLQLSSNERMAMGKEGRRKVKTEFDERIIVGKYMEWAEAQIEQADHVQHQN